MVKRLLIMFVLFFGNGCSAFSYFSKGNGCPRHLVIFLAERALSLKQQPGESTEEFKDRMVLSLVDKNLFEE